MATTMITPTTQVTPFPSVPVGPGMTTSALGGSIGGMMTPQQQARMWQLEDRKEAERKANNAQIIAQRNAEAQARQTAENEARVHAAFNQTYGPQIQRAFRENAVQSAPTNTPIGKMRDWAIGHGFTSGGTIGQPGTDITDYAAGTGLQMKPDQIQNTLNYMWRQGTDPYQRAATQLGGNMTRQMYPTDVG
jgi:hypothetical protein